MGKSRLQILIRSTLTAYLLTAIALVLLAFGLYRFHFTEAQVGLGVKGIYILVCLISGIIAGKMAKTRRFLWGFLDGAAYFLVLLTVSLLINRHLDSSGKDLAFSFVMCAGSGMLGGMIS